MKFKSLQALSLIVVLFVMNSCTNDPLPIEPVAVAPVISPVSTPVTPTVSTVTTPVSPAVAPPVSAPVTPPVSAPVTPPVSAPVTPPVSTPVTPPVSTPVTPPVSTPVTPPVSIPVTPPVSTNTYSYSTIENETMNLINVYRVSVGLNALIKTDYISSQAEQHNIYMIANNIMDHAGFDTRYQNIKSAIGAKSVGENVAFNYSSAQAVLNAWLASPGHKANIEGNFTHFGISVRSDSAGKKYYTNIFARI